MKNLTLLFAIFILMLSHSNSFGQKREKAEAYEDALIHHQEMKKGALLVRLKTQENKIKALKERGNTIEAANIEFNQHQENKEIIAAFKENFNFCKVYFFYSSDTKLVKKKQLEQVTFLGDSLEKIDTPKITTFYTAEFGNVDNTKQTQNSSEISSSLGFAALYIMTDQFVQLKQPFPYYSKLRGIVPIVKLKKSVIVEKLNSKLHEFN